MANTKITTNVIADDAITSAKIADDAINSEHYTDGSIDTAHIADDQVTLAKMAGLARGKIIYGDSSGNPAALAPGSNGQVLKSDGTDIAWGTDSGGLSTSGGTLTGALTIQSSSSGATADSGANDLIVENSGNSGISILSGASSSGSIYFGDSGSAYDGYINYSQSNQRMGFATAGTGRMYIDSSGDVGIGTSTPNLSSSALTLTLTSSTEPCLEFQGTRTSDGNTGMIRFYNSSDQIGVIQMRRVGANNSGDMSFYTSNAGSLTEKVRITASGNVGIGITNPTAPLYVQGNAVVTGNIISTGDTNIIYDSDDNCIFSRANGSETMRMNSSGNVAIATTDAGNAKLVIGGGVSAGADTACIDIDGYGSRGEGASQSINFRMGRTGQATDQPAQIKSFFMGGGATAGQTSIGFMFTTIAGNTQQDQFLIDAAYSRFKFNTSESPQSNNPQTNNCIVIGPSSSGAVTQSLTNACVLQNRAGELYAVDSSHNNTQLTPHNWGLISSGPSEELAWTYYSQRPNPSNNEQLQTINVDMAKVIRKVEDLVGEKLIYTENSEKDGHTFKTIISDIQTTLADLKTRVEALEG